MALGNALRDYLQGEASLLNLIVMGIGYVILAGMMSIKWSLLYKMTGSLWLGLEIIFSTILLQI
ncbi:MAG: hypothetical protein ACLRWM_15175 [Streptococcus sp.]